MAREIFGVILNSIKSCSLEQGHERAEQLMVLRMGSCRPGASLYDPANIMLMHHLYAAVRAHSLYHKDQHYVVQNK